MSTGRRSSNTIKVLSPLRNAAAPVVAVERHEKGGSVHLLGQPGSPGPQADRALRFPAERLVQAGFAGSAPPRRVARPVAVPRAGTGARAAAGRGQWLGHDGRQRGRCRGQRPVAAAAVDRPPSSGDDAIVSGGRGGVVPAAGLTCAGRWRCRGCIHDVQDDTAVHAPGPHLSACAEPPGRGSDHRS